MCSAKKKKKKKNRERKMLRCAMHHGKDNKDCCSFHTTWRRSSSLCVWRPNWFRSTSTTTTTTTPRTLVQQVHLPNVDLAKLLTVAKLDLRERRRIGNHNCTIIDECVTLTSGKYFPVASCASFLELNGGHLLEKDKQGRHYLELNQVETTVQCLLSWFSVWTLSCRCRVQIFSST